MEAAQDMISQTPDYDDAAATPPLQRYAVIVGERANSGSAFRIEDPARLLRVYSLLRRILPSHDAVPSAGALRIECAVSAQRRPALTRR
jgi:hypothetical protein